MYKKRIHNSYGFQWTLLKDGTPLDLTGKDLIIVMRSDLDAVQMEHLIVEGNVINWTWPGTTQKFCGKYDAVLIEDKDTAGMAVIDTEAAIELVAHTWEESDLAPSTIELQTVVSLVPGPQGVGIDRIVYNQDYTLTIYLTDGSSYTTGNIRGEKGDEPVITADAEGNIYVDGELLTSIVRVVAELATSAAADASTKAAQASAAATAANTAASGANTAATNANTKAALAETAAGTASTAAAGADAKAALAQAAADNADAKAALANTAAGTANTAASGADTAAANANTKAGLANTAAGAATAAAASANSAAATATEKAGLANTAAQTANAAAAAADAAREGIQEDLDKKANKDGWYQTLTSGLSENLVDTKGAGTEQAFTDRTSCGEESIADDGSGIIKELRGNSIVWNQQLKIQSSSASATSNNVTLVDNRDGSFSVSTTEAGASAYTSFQCVRTGLIEGHKYLLKGGPNGGSASTFMLSMNNTYASNGGQDLGGGVIFTALASIGVISLPQIRVFKEMVITTPITFWPKLIDLTLEFGVGKEPATVEEFVAMYRAKYYPQNDGTILNNAAATLVTDGFNQWDEEWEVGNININTGQDEISTTNIRSKNFIPAFPETTYYCRLGSGTGLRICAYDSDKNYISTISGLSSLANTTFLTPANTRYIRFGTVGYGATYNHDICINLSWSGYRNGEYEPYWKRVTGVDMRKIYGKLNGQGEMTQVFPDGGRSAGDAYDVAEIFEKKEADVRLGVVDMGTLTWNYSSTALLFTANVQGMYHASITNFKNILCAKYPVATQGTSTRAEDKSIYARPAGSYYGVGVKDSAYTDAATFKAAMSGVPLVYELAEPLHYTDLMYSEDGGQTFVDIPTVFKVADFGTERIEPLVDAQGNPVTAPFRAVIKYSDDFTRTLVNLPKNYDTTGGLDDLLAELSSVLGTALNGTLSIARGAYNTATKKYAWSVSFTPNE